MNSLVFPISWKPVITCFLWSKTSISDLLSINPSHILSSSQSSSAQNLEIDFDYSFTTPNEEVVDVLKQSSLVGARAIQEELGINLFSLLLDINPFLSVSSPCVLDFNTVSNNLLVLLLSSLNSLPFD